MTIPIEVINYSSDDVRARHDAIAAMSDLDFLRAARQVLVDDRDELAVGQFISQTDDPRLCHCVAGAALQACGVYVPQVRNSPWLIIPAAFHPLEHEVLLRLAPLLEPVFDETLIRAAKAKASMPDDFADIDETVTWSDLLDPAGVDRSGKTPGALVFTYNDYVLAPLGNPAAKDAAIALYDRAIIRAEETS